MSTQLRNNVYKMCNAEIIGLAKNRWLPTDIQLAIAKHPYRRGHIYLAENSGLSIEARDHLWSDECNRGYTLKASLLANGHYGASDPEKYWEFYDRFSQYWGRSPWTISPAFFGEFWCANGLTHQCPSDLLNRIYDDRFSPSRRALLESEHHHQVPNTRYQLRMLAKHNRVDLELAIKLSQSGIEEIEKAGFKKLVELNK